MSSTNAITTIRRRLFSKKIGTFIICLGIASLLWVVHALNVNYKYTLTVPVKFLNLPNNKLIVGDLPETLQIDIKASGLKLLFISLQSKKEELTIDFNSLKTNAKSQAYSISNGNFNLKSSINFDVEVLKIRPDTLFFSLNKANTKLVPIKAVLSASLVAGYSIISKPAITPAFVIVSGEPEVLKQVDTIYTQPIHIKNINKNYSSTISLNKPNSNLNFSTKEVQIAFEVDRLTEASLKIPIQVANKNTTQRLKLLPEFITIHYLVAMKDYDEINVSSFKATVNYNQVIQKEKKLKVEITRSPSEIKIIKIDPININYLIYK